MRSSPTHFTFLQAWEIICPMTALCIPLLHVTGACSLLLLAASPDKNLRKIVEKSKMLRDDWGVGKATYPTINFRKEEVDMRACIYVIGWAVMLANEASKISFTCISARHRRCRAKGSTRHLSTLLRIELANGPRLEISKYGYKLLRLEVLSQTFSPEKLGWLTRLMPTSTNEKTVQCLYYSDQ